MHHFIARQLTTTTHLVIQRLDITAHATVRLLLKGTALRHALLDGGLGFLAGHFDYTISTCLVLRMERGETYHEHTQQHAYRCT